MNHSGHLSSNKTNAAFRLHFAFPFISMLGKKYAFSRKLIHQYNQTEPSNIQFETGRTDL